MTCRSLLASIIRQTSGRRPAKAASIRATARSRLAGTICLPTETPSSVWSSASTSGMRSNAPSVTMSTINRTTQEGSWSTVTTPRPRSSINPASGFGGEAISRPWQRRQQNLVIRNEAAKNVRALSWLIKRCARRDLPLPGRAADENTPSVPTIQRGPVVGTVSGAVILRWKPYQHARAERCGFSLSLPRLVLRSTVAAADGSAMGLDDLLAKSTSPRPELFPNASPSGRSV